MLDVRHLRELIFGAFTCDQANTIYDVVVGQAAIMFDSHTDEEILGDPVIKEEFIAFNQIIDTMIAFGAYDISPCDKRMREFYLIMTAKGKEVLNHD